MPDNATILGPDGQPLGPDGQPITREYADGYALPIVLTFGSIVGSGWRTFYLDRWDEAMRHAREDALAMRNDADLMGMLQERKRAVARSPWHLEIDDEKDLYAVAVRDGMDRILRKTPHLKRMMMSELEAVWYGRYGINPQWYWDVLQVPSPTVPGTFEARRCLRIRKHRPVNGDKIGHTFQGTPFVLIYGAAGKSEFGDAEIITTTVQHALTLRGSWAEQVLIHTHYDVDDGDYFDAEVAEANFGIGLRTRLFWWDWIKREWLARLSDWLDRVGLGISVWTYPGGNAKALEETRAAAKEQGGKLNLLVPTWPDGSGKPQTALQRIETPTAGAEVLTRLMELIRKIEERFIVGQQASSRSETGGMGTHDTDLQAETKSDITELDADNLAETHTGSEEEPGILSVTLKWTYPEIKNNAIGLRWVFGVKKGNQQAAQLDGAKVLFDMKVPVRADEVREAAGFSKPNPGDEIVQNNEPAAVPGLGGNGDGGPPGLNGNGNGHGGPGGPGGNGNGGPAGPNYGGDRNTLAAHYRRLADRLEGLLDRQNDRLSLYEFREEDHPRDDAGKFVLAHTGRLLEHFHQAGPYKRHDRAFLPKRTGLDDKALGQALGELQRAGLVKRTRTGKSEQWTLTHEGIEAGRAAAAGRPKAATPAKTEATPAKTEATPAKTEATADPAARLAEVRRLLPRYLNIDNPTRAEEERLDALQAEAAALVKQLQAPAGPAAQAPAPPGKAPAGPAAQAPAPPGKAPLRRQLYDELAQEHAAAVQAARKPGALPALTGSEAQKDFAAKVRGRQLNAGEALLGRMKGHAKAEAVREVLDALWEVDDSGYWLDHGKQDFKALYTETRKRLDEGRALTRRGTLTADFARTAAPVNFFRWLQATHYDFAREPKDKGKPGDRGGEWLTIGKGHHGAKVFVVNGRITKGCDGLVGRELDEDGEVDPPSEPEQKSGHETKNRILQHLAQPEQQGGADLAGVQALGPDAPAALAALQASGHVNLVTSRSGATRVYPMGKALEAPAATPKRTRLRPQLPNDTPSLQGLVAALDLQRRQQGQQILGNIAAGEGRLWSKVDGAGKKLTRSQLLGIEKEIARSRGELGQLLGLDPGEGLSHQQEMNRGKEAAAALWRKKAKQAGLKPADLDSLASDLLKHDKGFKDELTDMLQAARKASGGALDTIRARGARGIDADQVRGLDDIAQEMAATYPHWFAGYPSAEERLFDLLSAGNPEPMERDEAYQQAFDHLQAAAAAGGPAAAAEGPDEWAVQRTEDEELVPFFRWLDSCHYAGLFDEELHPRDQEGKWTEKQGGLFGGGKAREPEAEKETEEPAAGPAAAEIPGADLGNGLNYWENKFLVRPGQEEEALATADKLEAAAAAQKPGKRQQAEAEHSRQTAADIRRQVEELQAGATPAEHQEAIEAEGRKATQEAEHQTRRKEFRERNIARNRAKYEHLRQFVEEEGYFPMPGTISRGGRKLKGKPEDVIKFGDDGTVWAWSGSRVSKDNRLYWIAIEGEMLDAAITSTGSRPADKPGKEPEAGAEDKEAKRLDLERQAHELGMIGPHVLDKGHQEELATLKGEQDKRILKPREQARMIALDMARHLTPAEAKAAVGRAYALGKKVDAGTADDRDRADLHELTGKIGTDDAKVAYLAIEQLAEISGKTRKAGAAAAAAPPKEPGPAAAEPANEPAAGPAGGELFGPEKATPAAGPAGGHVAALEALGHGELGHVGGHYVRRLGENEYRLDTPQWHLTGTAAQIAERIDREALLTRFRDPTAKPRRKPKESDRGFFEADPRGVSQARLFARGEPVNFFRWLEAEQYAGPFEEGPVNFFRWLDADQYGRRRKDSPGQGMLWDEELHPRDDAGKWTDKGEGAGAGPAPIAEAPEAPAAPPAKAAASKSLEPVDVEALRKELRATFSDRERREMIEKTLADHARPVGPMKAHGMTDTEDMQMISLGGLDGITVMWAANTKWAAIASLQRILTNDIPAALWNATKRMVFSTQSNKDDGYWRDRYQKPDFITGATGGDGTIVVYNGGEMSEHLFAHEAGHNLATKIWGTTTPWASDAHSQYFDAQAKEKPVTPFGALLPSEDFAEACMLYADRKMLQSYNPVTHSYQEDSTHDKFKRDFPRKWKALRRLMGD